MTRRTRYPQRRRPSLGSKADFEAKLAADRARILGRAQDPKEALVKGLEHILEQHAQRRAKDHEGTQ
jgi:hypothetical protein